MRNSTLSEHNMIKGVFKTKFNELLGDKLSEQNWFYERMPEYIWIGLVFKHYGRDNGLYRMYKITVDLVKEMTGLKTLRISDILELKKEDQMVVFSIIERYVQPKVLSPLTIIIDSQYSKEFCIKFLEDNDQVENRLEKLSEIIRIQGDGSSDFSTDIRFVLVYFLISTGHLKFVGNVGKEIFEYPKLKQDDPMLHIIGSSIRSMELIVLSNVNREISREYLEVFWERMFRMTECKLMFLEYAEEKMDLSKKVEDVKSLLISYKMVIIQSYPLDLKRIVSLGITTFAFKRWSEIIECKLGNNLAGRSSLRGMIECLFILKYLMLKESTNPNIWKEYQLHGIGKFKLIYERYSEVAGDKPQTHVPFEYLDILVNEFKDKEFIDMDTRYFDGLSARPLSEMIDEKDLYNFYYDYDSSYEHALWGAIRESCFLKCENPEHMYHFVPDIENEQNLKSVIPDSIIVMDKILSELSTLFNSQGS